MAALEGFPLAGDEVAAWEPRDGAYRAMYSSRGCRREPRERGDPPPAHASELGKLAEERRGDRRPNAGNGSSQLGMPVKPAIFVNLVDTDMLYGHRSNWRVQERASDGIVHII